MNRQNTFLVFAFAFVFAGCTGGAGQEAPRRHVIEIGGFGFHPAALSVAAGDTIVWVNQDAVPHTATSGEGKWDSGSIVTQESWSLVAGPGDGGEYICDFHPTMTGQLTVR